MDGGWISVKDRLPTEDDGAGRLAPVNDRGPFVIAFWDNGDESCFEGAYCEPEGWYDSSVNPRNKLLTPTHWRRWPEPPKEAS